MECGDVPMPGIARLRQIRASPCKLGPLQNGFKKNVRHQSCVPAVSIGKWMNRNKSMMKTNGHLIGFFLPQVYPKAGVIA